VRFDSLPVIPRRLEWVKQGVATGASERNWKGYGGEVDLSSGAADWTRKLLTDPQTSGGLLVRARPEAVPAVLQAFQQEGFADARVIGKVYAGDPRLPLPRQETNVVRP
jgi:selenide,water dikinase